MGIVVGVRFRGVGKSYYFDPSNLSVKKGERVVVETARGVECGEVTIAPREVPEEQIVRPLKPVLRAATEEDLKTVESNRRKEREAFAVACRKIRERELAMKMVDVEYTFDGQKILFYFTADGRVDFRELVKDLAGVFRTRIELRQIGVRDESKMLGGIGICGRPFCCSEFLFDFQPVSIKMAKEQGISLNPVKISGACGRLMCCLKYEQEVYEDLIRTTPRVGSSIDTPDGKGTVIDVSLISGNLKVRLDSGPDLAPRVYTRAQLNGEEPDAHRDEAPLRTGTERPHQQREQRSRTNNGSKQGEQRADRQSEQGKKKDSRNNERRPADKPAKPLKPEDTKSAVSNEQPEKQKREGSSKRRYGHRRGGHGKGREQQADRPATPQTGHDS